MKWDCSLEVMTLETAMALQLYECKTLSGYILPGKKVA